MSNDIKDNNNESNLNFNDEDNDNIIKEKNSEDNSDKENSKDSIDSKEYNEKLEDERLKFLNNPGSFKRKRDFFSFYSKHRQSAIIPKKTAYTRRITRLKSQIIMEKPEVKMFSKFELRPRGFGVSKIKEKIEFFEKKILENKYKTINLTPHQKTYYDNNELKKFNSNLFKIESLSNILISPNGKIFEDKRGIKKNYKILSEEHFSIGSDNKKQKNENKKTEQKLNLNLIVDYSKILNSSKITKKEKVLDLFMTENKDETNESNKKKIQDALNDSSDSSSSKEVSTNLSHGNGSDQTTSKYNRQNSEICYYKDLLKKMSTPIKKSNLQSLRIDTDSSQLKGTNKDNNNKYILVKTNDNKICLEKQGKFKSGIKKVLSENISDSMTLKKLDNAKYKLNQVNNNKKIKRQILDMLDNLIIDKNNNNNKNSTNDKINNLYDRQKLIRAFEIVPQLSLIKQKINTLLQNNDYLSETNNKDSLNFCEKDIKKYASSIYFLECIGLEPIILFNEKNTIENKKFINDIGEDIQLITVNNKKKYIKYYCQNLKKTNLLLEILINNINNIQDNINM